MTGDTALGFGDGDLLNLTVWSVYEAHLRAHPDGHYLRTGGRDYSYREICDLSATLATRFVELGLRRGDRVTTWLPNGLEWIVSAIALSRLGVINILTNSRFRPREVADLVVRSRSRAMISTVQLDLSLAAEPPRDATLEWSVVLEPEAVPGLGPQLVWAELMAGKPDIAAIEKVGAGTTSQDILYVMYTSGTTGQPKGSMTRHGAALQNAFNSGERMGFSDRDRLLCFVPMAHCFGSVNAYLNTLTHGSRFDLDPDFDAREALTAVHERGVTAIYGVPTHYTTLADAHAADGRKHDLSSLTKGIIGGGLVTKELSDMLQNELGITGLTHSYGMTESTAIITQSAWDEATEQRLYTAGKVMPGVEIRFVDDETDVVVEPGVGGRIQIRGFNVHAGYLDIDPDPAMKPDGWWDTGDLGSLDTTGRLRIFGRSKDMYKTSGFNVYPAEVEAYLARHPSVQEVAVVGISHDRKQETGVAFVILVEGATIDSQQIIEFARQGLAGYKVPEHVLFVTELPRTAATLKIQKHVLRDEAEAALHRT